jgi:uncharacterized protein YbjT (DUF2867 family)
MSHKSPGPRPLGMTTFAVIGGTGNVGRHIVDTLRAAGPTGAEVRVLSRGSAEHPVDLATGAGVADALAACDVVVDAANGSPRRPEPVLVDGARRLMQTCAQAGVGHLVCVSIVGIDQVPSRYYRAKLAQEDIVKRQSDVPWTIVRSTQFHELVEAALSGLARWRLSPRSSARLQPVAAWEAGEAIAAVALDPQPGRTVTVGGPERRDVSELARTWAHARHRRGLPLGVPLIGRMREPLLAGALTCPNPDRRGSVAFETWLTSQS